MKAKEGKLTIDDAKKLPKVIVLTGILAEFQDFLNAEIVKIEKCGQTATSLKNGKQMVCT